MTSNYFIDTTKFPIEKLRNILKSKEILPGRALLKEKIDERFDLLIFKGITSLSILLETLNSKNKIKQFSNETGLGTEYLTILRREANSYVSTPLNLKELPFSEIEIISRLQKNGFTNTKNLFDSAAKLVNRKKLALTLNMDLNTLTEIVQLCDLVRITGVGPIFAQIIFESEIKTVKDFICYDSSVLLEKLTKTNDKNGFTKVKFSLKDIEYCIELGKYLPIALEE